MKIGKKACFLLCILFSIFLVYRDLLNKPINKYLFVILMLVIMPLMNIENIITFLFFIIPISNGLPGNYIRAVVLLFLIIKGEKENISRLKLKLLFLAIILWIYEFLHITSFSQMFDYLFFGVNIILIIYIISQDEEQINAVACIYAFSLSTSFSFFVMFINTFKFIDFSLILSGRYRFGDFTVFAPHYTTEMHLTIDPNYLGYFCVSSIAALVSLLIAKKAKAKSVMPLIIINSFWGILSLSRTFVLATTLFVLLIIFYQLKTPKSLLLTLLGMCFFTGIAYYIVKSVYPEIFRTIIHRFQARDFTGGRTELLILYMKEFFRNIKFLLFGTGCIGMTKNVGIYNDLHSTPAQFLVGYGTLGFPLVVYLIYNIGVKIKEKMLQSNQFGSLFWINLTVHILYLSSLPSVENIVQLYLILLCPIVATISCASVEDKILKNP